MNKEKHFFILGCPDDRGVANNNGRPGAVEGPAAFYKTFERIKSVIDDKFTFDYHEIELEDRIPDTHQNAVKSLKNNTPNASFSIVIGGGHDYAFPHLKGIHQSFSGQLGCINIDPHFDLRKAEPKILSGSPFRMAIEEEILDGRNLVEFGIGHHCNSKELWEYARAQSVETIPFSELRNGPKTKTFEYVLEKLCQRTDQIVLSIDLDALQAAFAPGVSAPAAEGFDPSEILAMTQIAACNKKVVSLGIYELNPKYDQNQRTARLAALIAFEFIRNKIK